MLCPEVWHFREPASNFKVEIGSLDREDCFSVADCICCNHLVTAVVPDTFKVPENIANTLQIDTEYYRVEGIPVKELVDGQFLRSFVKKGKLTALSVGTRIDCEDCVLVTPEGDLVLSLVKDTYQKLGVEGKVSQFHKKTKARYVIKIDLNNIKPGKYYERIKERLSQLKTTLLIKWEPHEDNICPSSIANYFHKRGFVVKECTNEYTTRIEYSVNVPHVNFDNADAVESSEFVEWLGALALGVDLENGSPDDFINTYQTPEPNATFGQVRILQWRGFFSSKEIKQLFDLMRKYVQEENKQWVALYVQGFSDCPFGWRKIEHNFFTNGDNGYVITLNENKYLLFVQTCSNKQYK